MGINILPEIEQQGYINIPLSFYEKEEGEDVKKLLGYPAIFGYHTVARIVYSEKIMKKLLVVRNDKLGDFMLAWPAFAMLKQSAPDWHITALVPKYTESLARLCPFIDDVIIDAGKRGDKQAQQVTLADIKKMKFDAVINFFSDTYNTLLMYKAGIPFRMAPATKLIQFFYNHRVVQRRSRSLKPEYVYNLDLARAFLEKQGVAVQEPQPPYLYFTPDTITQQKHKLAQQLALAVEMPWVFVHAGSGGSANNLSIEQYALFILALLQQTDCAVVLTAGPGETAKAQQLWETVKSLYTTAKMATSVGVENMTCRVTEELSRRVVIYDKNDGLVDFARSLACANVFVAGSTGPLHICGALNIPTIGFYPSKRSATPLRWQTINQEDRRLAFSPVQGKATEDDLTSINMDTVIRSSLPFVKRYLG